jgi:FHA domain
MSRPQLTLTVRDEGLSREVAVEATRFTIGFGADNDLVIEDSGLARRHALIESFDGVAQISDCGSESGTYVNGNRVRAGAALRNGDVISIGSACVLVRITAGGTDSAETRDQVGRNTAWIADRVTDRFSTPVIAVAAAGLMLTVAALLMLFVGGAGRKSINRISHSPDLQLDGEKDRQREVEHPEGKLNADSSKAITLEAVEKAAAQFMRRISSDDRPYVFPPYAVDALEDVRRRVEQYSSSASLSSRLRSIATSGQAVAAEARREGIEPGLAVYAAFAEAESGATADLMAGVLQQLISLRKTFGTESADKSLILVAAYKMGGGTKKSHPLLRTMTRVVKNPLTDRNVWFLREHGGLDDQAYAFVVRFVALGVIAENPRRFGVAGEPVAF